MPSTNNNPEDVLGSTADLNAGGAIQEVQAEQIKRLESEKQQAQAANPTPQPLPNPPLITAEDVLSLLPPAAPLSAADMMQEAAQEAQARTSAAEARAAGFHAQAAAPVSPAPPPAPASIPNPIPRRSSFDAAEANARAANASQGFPVAQDPSKVTFSAPKDAANAFDWEAYEQARQTGCWTEPTPQPMVSAESGTPSYARVGMETAADDPRVAPSPSYARVGMDEDLWASRVMANGDKIDRVDAAFANRVPEYQQEIEAQRARAASIAAAVSPTEDAPGSFRDRFASYTADWAEVGAAYRQSASEPFGEKFDSFADTAARFGVDTGVLGERVRGVGQAALANIQHELKSPYAAMQAGFALEAVGKSAGAYYEQTNSGRYLTPEQQGEAQAGMLPSILGAVGTVVGAATPLGAWGGSLVGSGIGSAAQGILTAGYEREQAVRETSSIYGTATGESAAALRDFTDSLRQANVATKEAYAAFTTLASAGPGIGAGTLPGVALMSGALGERYNPALSGLSHALSSDPILRALQPQMSATGGNLGAGRLGDIAVAEAFSGNWGASNDAATLAEGALTNPQYAKDANNADRAESWAVYGDLFTNWHALGRDLSGQVKHYHAGGSFLPNIDDPNQYVPGADAERARIAKDRAGAYALYTQGASAEEIAKTGVGLAAARLGIAENQGATDAQLGATAQGLYSAVAAGVPKLTQEAAGIDGYLADHPNMDAATRLKMQQTRDGYLTEAYGMEGQQAQTQKALFGRSLETEQSGFALGDAVAGYSGQSFASRAGIYRTQEDFLTGTADNPGPLSPSERNSLRQSVLDQRRTFQQGELGEEEAGFGLSITKGTLSGRSAASLQTEYDRQADYLQHFAQSPNSLLTATERTGIQQNAAQMHYEAGRSVFQESMGWQGVRDVQGQGAISAAQTFGSPMDVYRADIGQVANQQAEVGLIDARLRQNIPMSERIPLMNQRQGIENDIQIAPERARVDAYNAEGSILADNQAAGRSLLDRNAQVYGAKAFTPDIFAADQASISLYTGAEQGSPLGSLQRAVFGHQAADAQAQMTRDRDSSYRFGDAAQRVGDMQAEGAFHRALEAPYMSGGPESDPLLRGMALEKTYQRDLVGVEAALARTPRDSPAYEYNAGLEQDYKNKIAGVEFSRDFELEKRFPMVLAGGGGLTGNSMGVFPVDALGAAFAPSYLHGSWGSPHRPAGGTVPGSAISSSYDGFQQYAGAQHAGQQQGAGAVPASGIAGVTAAVQSLAHGMDNRQIAGLLQQILTELQAQRTSYRGQPQGGPPQTSTSSARLSLAQGFNSNRPSR